MTHHDIDSLLDEMTLDEQVSLLSGADFWHTAPIERLDVPSAKVTDGPNGARGGIFKDGPSTACFPVGISLASTWSPTLVQQAGAALGQEAKQKGAHGLLAPTVNLHRTVLNGRNFECYSEDPWLTSEIAIAYVRGVQSTGVAATIKHFVGNESEFQRMSMSSDISERALRELYLLPFERAVKEAGVWAVMTAYNRLDGTFASNHSRLITEVLREEWGFDGMVMTDWFAEHETVKSVLAGTDLEMPGPTRYRGAALVQAVNDGRLPVKAIRDCARRVLQFMSRVGSFEGPPSPEERAEDLPAHRNLIRKLGAEGMVLLKNENQILPLTATANNRVALIGIAAKVPQIMGGGSATVNAHYRVSPLDGLRSQWPVATFSHHPGADVHRWVPVVLGPVKFEFFDSPDFNGPAVFSPTLESSEQMWAADLPTGVTGAHFSLRASLRFVAQQAGLHQFSLISAGLSRAYINGVLAVDAWTHWSRGETYFTFGCEEVLHTRQLETGEVCEIEIEYTTQAHEEVPFRALRFGAYRPLDTFDIAEAVEAAHAADVAVVFAGLNAEWDNEGLDRHSLELPHMQNALIARVAAVNPRTVVVLQTGAPVTLPWLDSVPAVLQAWYPGQECGNAIADVLLGAADPGGHLPQTWPLRLSDTVGHGALALHPSLKGHVQYEEGVFIGYRHYQRAGLAVQFPFGYGLSYGGFEYGRLRGVPQFLAPNDTITVELDVRNVGLRSGHTLLQLFVHQVQPSVARPPKELKAFAKLQIAPGAIGTARMTLGMRAFAFYDVELKTWRADAGMYVLYLGRHADDDLATAQVTLISDWTGA